MSCIFSGFDWLLDAPDTIVECLECSVSCYTEALGLLTDVKGEQYNSLTKRLGNAYNELGVCQMQKALEKAQTESKLYLRICLVETTFVIC